MKSSVSGSKTKSVAGDMANFASVDARSDANEGTVVETTVEAAAGVYPNILVVTFPVDTGWQLFGGSTLSELSLVAEVDVLGN